MSCIRNDVSLMIVIHVYVRCVFMYILIYFDSWKYMLLDDLKGRVFDEQFRELLRTLGILTCIWGYWAGDIFTE